MGFIFVKSVHMVKDCAVANTQGRESNQAQETGLNSYDPKKNFFHSLKSRGDQEGSLDVVTGMLQVI